jgi:ABC-type sugar transport system ATPase subunit
MVNSATSPARQPASADAPLLLASGIAKRFGITQALDNVTVSFAAGEVHALMGENGAGKSTLGKVIAGLHKQDAGTVTIAGHTLKPGSIDEANAAGIRLIHQELAQCANLSVAENLCLASIPRTRLGLVDFPAMTRRARTLLAGLEPGIDVNAPLGTLPPGHRQIVQIAAALGDGDEISYTQPTTGQPRVIVFDEPTSSLSIAEVDRLLAIIRQISRRGITCIYVSHRMSEIFAVCDRVSVLRDGKFVATSDVRSIAESDLVEQMIGRKVPPTVRRVRPESSTSAKPALVVESVSSASSSLRSGATPLRSISLSVQPGEILGIGGLVGAGRSELLDAVFGLDRAATGEVSCAGTTLSTGRSHAGPRASIAAGMGYVPEDRKLQGLFFQLSVSENIAVPVMPALSASPLGIRNAAAESRHVSSRLKAFQVKTAGPSAVPGSLSGGNQQKLLIARWMGESTKVLLLDEPTRGIDVGTKAEIYRLVREAAERGLAVVLVSSDMPELLALSDRIIVLSDGKLTGELTGNDMTQANILKLATIGH